MRSNSSRVTRIPLPESISSARRSRSGLSAVAIARTRSSDQSENPCASATRRISRAVKNPRDFASSAPYARSISSTDGFARPSRAPPPPSLPRVVRARARVRPSSTASSTASSSSLARASTASLARAFTASLASSTRVTASARAVSIPLPLSPRDAPAPPRVAPARASRVTASSRARVRASRVARVEESRARALDSPAPHTRARPVLARTRAVMERARRPLALDDPDRAGDEWARRERASARDCFKTPEGRYNLGKTWRTKPASRTRESAVGEGSGAEYDARCRRRVIMASAEGQAYVLVNSGDCVRALDYEAATDRKAAAKIGFSGGVVTAMDFRVRGDGERYDLLVGLSNGEVWAMDFSKNVAEKGKWATASTRWNSEGDGVNKSRVTAVYWRPRGEYNSLRVFDCVSLHADGSMYTYDSSRDGARAKFEPLADVAALSVVSSGDPGSNPLARWHFGRSSLNAAAFSPDSRYLAIVNGAGMCRVLDVAHDRPNIVAGFKSYYAGFHAVAWSPCGRYVLAGGESDMIEIWGLYEREVLAWGVQGHRAWITDIAVDALAAGDHSILRFASVGEDCRVALWDWRLPTDDVSDDDGDDDALEDRAAKMSVSSLPKNGRGPSFSGPDAKISKSAHRDDVERLVPLMTHKLHTSPVTAVRFTDEAALTATSDCVKLWLRPTQPSRYVRKTTDDMGSDSNW